MTNQCIARHCAPTLAGIKTGNMFSVHGEERRDVEREISGFNRRFAGHGLRLVPLRRSDSSALLYVYRPEQLRRDFAHPLARKILEERGYAVESPEKCVVKLAQKLAAEKDFPHEIGLFLGYPPEDVQGFIEHPREGVKCVGHWKVYGDRERAEELFTSYRKCTALICGAVEKGRPLDKMVVSNRGLCPGL